MCAIRLFRELRQRLICKMCDPKSNCNPQNYIPFCHRRLGLSRIEIFFNNKNPSRYPTVEKIMNSYSLIHNTQSRNSFKRETKSRPFGVGK